MIEAKAIEKEDESRAEDLVVDETMERTVAVGMAEAGEVLLDKQPAGEPFG